MIATFHSYAPNKKAYNALCITIGGVQVFYSYQTPVAFRTADGRLVVRQNEWNQTSGKHLNWIDGGDQTSRIPGKEFVKRLVDATV